MATGVAFVVAVGSLAGCGSDGKDAGSGAKLQTVTFQKPESPGPDPFTEPADVRGDEEVDLPKGQGPFGGTGSDLVCDRDRLIRFLRDNPEQMREWARVLGLRETYGVVKRYIGRLHPVTLTRDTRVTNHSFVNGHAVAFQSILQAGTAVLVDQYGRPVARCRCGNPLTPPTAITTARCDGCPANYHPPPPCDFYGRRTNYDRTYYRRTSYSNGDYDEVFIRSHRSSRFRRCSTAYPDPPTVTIVDVFPSARTTRPPAQRGTEESPSASFSPSSGGQDTTFTISVSGFAPNTTLAFDLTRPDGVREHYSITTGATGSGSHVFPPGGNRVEGTYRAVVRNPRTGASASASVTVVPAQTRTETQPQQQPEQGGLQCNPPRSQLEFEQCAEQGR